MRVEIVAVGTELLLGQIADTNSAWLGEQLAASGVDSHFHQAVGDNHARIVLALRTALARCDGVIVCGGLGPTQDDITREAIAEVMNVPLVRDEEIVARIAGVLRVPRQGDVGQQRPAGRRARGAHRSSSRSRAPPRGWSARSATRCVYAVPGVPHEMAEMFARGILPDLRRRMAAGGGESVIVSRVLRTWGSSESALAEALQGRIDALDGGPVTIAFLASGIEGIKVRVTARAATEASRAVPARRRGSGGPPRPGPAARRHRVRHRRPVDGGGAGRRPAPAGSDPGGRRVADRGAHRLATRRRPGGQRVVQGRRRRLRRGRQALGPGRAGRTCGDARRRPGRWPRVPAGCSVPTSAWASPGVAGPEEQEGVAAGTVFVGLALRDGPALTRGFRLPGDRPRIRQYSAISALDMLRRELLSPAG